jgi:hypothetical protein
VPFSIVDVVVSKYLARASSILVPYADITFDETDLQRRKLEVESFKFTFSGSTDWYVARNLTSLDA